MSTKELVVQFRVPSWIDSTEVLHATEFLHSLTYEIAITQAHRRLHNFCYVQISVLILLHKLVDQELNLWVRIEVGNEQLIASTLRDWNASCKAVISQIGFCFTRSSSGLLEARILGSELQFVQGFFPSVESSYAAQVPSVTEQILLNSHVEWTFRR